MPQILNSLRSVRENGKGQWVASCPAHADSSPSLSIKLNGSGNVLLHCFAGCSIEQILEALGLTIRDLFEGDFSRGYSVNHHPIKSFKPLASKAKTCTCLAVPSKIEATFIKRSKALDRVPKALQGRGFTLEDCKALQVVNENGDALFPIYSPDGVMVNTKRRFANPIGESRYMYEVKGRGTPAWVSPNLLEANELLMIEGELNGMACWLVRPDLGVMGVAGTSGCLWLEALKNETVYVYADGDAPGQKARGLWAKTAYENGASKVYMLEAWEMDACDVLGKLGREALKEKLL
jgi:hypothetical protein